MALSEPTRRLLMAGAESRLGEIAQELQVIVDLNNTLKTQANLLLRPILKWHGIGRKPAPIADKASGKRLAADLAAARAARTVDNGAARQRKSQHLRVDKMGRRVTPRKPMSDKQKAMLSRIMKRRWAGAKKAGRSLNDGITHAEAIAALKPNGAASA